MRWLAAVFAALLALPVAAQQIPGEDDPEYGAAVEMWLAGEDLPALKALSTLAHANNHAAQILLAQIAANGHLHAHATAPLARKSRLALLRKPGGLSGKSWLTSASDVPLAQALLDSNSPERRTDAARRLLAEGEPMFAAQLLHVAITKWHSPDAAQIARDLAPVLIGDQDVLRAMIGYMKTVATVVNQGTQDAGGQSAAAYEKTLAAHPKGRLTWFGIPPKHFLEVPQLRDIAFAHSADVVALTPIADFCRAHCPQSVNSCVAVGGVELFLAGPLPFNSPSERLVPNNVYWASDRMQGDLLRRFKPDPARAALYAAHDTCFFPAVDAAATAGR